MDTWARLATTLLLPLMLLLLLLMAAMIAPVQPISIRPGDFERLVMPCYLGGSPLGLGASISGPADFGRDTSQFGRPPVGLGVSGPPGAGGQGPAPMNGPGSSYQPSYFGSDPGRPGAFSGGRDGLSGGLGQEVPRASTIDNFIALVSKIEAANPRLANNLDQLIKVLLSRFHLDGFYYDTRSRTPFSDEETQKFSEINEAILSNPMGPVTGGGYGSGAGANGQLTHFMLGTDIFPEQLLDQAEKCSMYFMLSHFIDKSSSSLAPNLASQPVSQLASPFGSQRPPNLQAAGSSYPAPSANQAFGNGRGYPGPPPGFGSPATSNMASFGQGINSQPDYNTGSSNPYGMNVVQPNLQSLNYNNPLRQGGLAGGSTVGAGSRGPMGALPTGYIDGQSGRGRADDRVALEYGVVTLPDQGDAALVLNRVLMGILAASMPPQSLRQLASMLYPMRDSAGGPKLDEDIDPLFAVTLASLWARTAIQKPGKEFNLRMLGDSGRWNDTMCPTQFRLERSSSIRFTTAEMLGGLDGLNLGLLRRRMMNMNMRNIRLSELLRIYYSKTGFRPQFAEVGVCNRITAVNQGLDDLKRQAENYLRLLRLNLPIMDNQISDLIQRVDSFKEYVRQAASTNVPRELCQDAGLNDVYPVDPNEECEVAKADLVTVLDTSPQANNAFMSQVVAKLAQRIGLSRAGNTLSVLTNQQDTSGYGGSTYNLNAIVRNSSNTAEIGCALAYDGSRSYQGGQITDPVRLVEMLERALVNVDTEFLVRHSVSSSGAQYSGSPSSAYRPYAYVSSLSSQTGLTDYFGQPMTGPRNTGGAKVIIWFNYGPQQRPSSLSSGPTNWLGSSNSVTGGQYSSSSGDQNQLYRFQEAKRLLRENYRGASILAVASSREDVRAFVYDESRDIFTDIPAGDSDAPTSDFRPSGSYELSSGAADQTVGKLMQRMCDIPALFQYPMCFRTPSEGVVSHVFVSPGRKQYWMMAPKTFFASRSVRMAFRVEGGRSRVCFGRMARPDESALRHQQQYPNSGGSSSGIAFANSRQQPMQLQQQQQPSSGQSALGQAGSSPLAAPAISSTGNDYYTGLEYGICKDVAPGQEIDFVVDDPCYKKSIAECEPFYFVIKETSRPGEDDSNYMCRDEGCKRFDQTKVTMLHTGVYCSSSLALIKANWYLIAITIVAAVFMARDDAKMGRISIDDKDTPKESPSKITTDVNSTNENRPTKRIRSSSSPPVVKQLAAALITLCCSSLELASAQQAGVYDFGQASYGARRGSLAPGEWLAIILVVMSILTGLALAIGLCYYVSKRAPQRSVY